METKVIVEISLKLNESETIEHLSYLFDKLKEYVEYKELKILKISKLNLEEENGKAKENN